MRRIPDARAVDRALGAAKTAVRHALKGLNQAAAHQMARGDYSAAAALATQGRAIQDFQTEVDALLKRWRDLRRGGAPTGSGNRGTPLWSYYQPILQALLEANGEARRTDLEPAVERVMREALQPADRESMARGHQRWQVMIRRARKHLSAEGWIEAGLSPVWRITDAGRRAASKPLAPAMGGAS